MTDRRKSFTSAGEMPIKLFHNAGLMQALDAKHVPPVHVQFMPTNKCNLHCKFCSCENRTRGDEMPIAEVRDLVVHMNMLGTQAVTITGGGEPLMHPDFEAIVLAFTAAGIEVGLVTNGTLLHTVDPDVLELLTWCRISCGDERRLPETLGDVVDDVDIDWAFSYVLSASPSTHNLFEHIYFANEHRFTHVRVVADLLNIADSPIGAIREAVGHQPLVLWQDRTEYTRGADWCWLSKLKPVIAADGSVYPCCGVQYALSSETLDLPAAMRMGHWRDFKTLHAFDGGVCVRCYYDNYNRVLDGYMHDAVAHKAFI